LAEAKMMDVNNFSFTTSARIIFGWGSRKTLPELIKPFGKKVLLLHSRSVMAIEEIESLLSNSDFSVQRMVITGEPTDEVIQRLLGEIKGVEIDVMIGIGGGSVLDAGKAISALVTNTGNLLDYLEVVGKGLALKNPPCPYIAVPTTAGTGTEVTKNAVIKVVSKNVKVSMRDTLMIPRIALVDPELTLSVPAAVTASTGMDAFIQVLEPYCSVGANKMVDLFCREGIPLAAQNLPVAYRDATNREARVNMAWVSLLGGLSLANAKLGAVHGFAGPIGGMFDIAHGVICACLLPQVFRINAKKVIESNNTELINRFRNISLWVTGIERAEIQSAVDWFIALNEELSIPHLKDIGVKEKDFETIIEKSLVSSSMKGNPVPLDRYDLQAILKNS
jgi:alcohol dehydrogenase class IV